MEKTRFWGALWASTSEPPMPCLRCQEIAEMLHELGAEAFAVHTFSLLIFQLEKTHTNGDEGHMYPWIHG